MYNVSHQYTDRHMNIIYEIPIQIRDIFATRVSKRQLLSNAVAYSIDSDIFYVVKIYLHVSSLTTQTKFLKVVSN